MKPRGGASHYRRGFFTGHVCVCSVFSFSLPPATVSPQNGEWAPGSVPEVSREDVGSGIIDVS